MAITKTAATHAWQLAMRAGEEVRWRKAHGAPADVVQRAAWRVSAAMSRYENVHRREARLYGCVRDCCSAKRAA